jgi:hypothetical protein
MSLEIRPRGALYHVTAQTGAVVATTAAAGSIFAMRNAPTAQPNVRKLTIVRVGIRVTVGTVFGTLGVVVGRRLQFIRGSGAAASGGTAIAAAAKSNSGQRGSAVDSAQGGDTRVSTTGALTVAGITFETVSLGDVSCESSGAGGAILAQQGVGSGVSREVEWTLLPGELLAVQQNVQFDGASGNYDMMLEVDFLETRQ